LVKSKTKKDKKSKKSKKSKSEKAEKFKPSNLGNLSRNVVVSDDESDADDESIQETKMAVESNDDELVLTDTRRWEDDKKNKSKFKRGAFQPEETELLMRALCQYCSENGLDEKGKQPYNDNF
jgi:hypothetical protein